MIRFLDLTSQIYYEDSKTEDSVFIFAFYDTIRDKICTFNNEQSWDSKADFVEDFLADNSHIFQGQLERFVGFIKE